MSEPERRKAQAGDGRSQVRPWRTTVRQIHERIDLLVEATFGYDPDDPWAVRACFREPLGRLVAWDLSRELLRSGTYGLSGEGEVRLWPLRSGGRHEYVRMRLGRDGACALVDVDRADLRSWLRETYAVVPDGYEADRIDWKTERARLFTEE